MNKTDDEFTIELEKKVIAIKDFVSENDKALIDNYFAMKKIYGNTPMPAKLELERIIQKYTS